MSRLKLHRHLSRARVWSLGLLVVALAGCQTTPPLSGGAPWQQRYLYKTTQWQAEGKIAIKAGDERETANFRWAQQRDNYVIHLFGPFGQGATWLRRTSKGVTLENAKIGTRSARSAEQLMQDVMGWQVPVANLQYWLRGLPAAKPAPSAVTHDTTGLLSELQQQGWQVEYRNHANFHGWWLPTKLVASRDDLLITVVVKDWQLPNAPSRPL